MSSTDTDTATPVGNVSAQAASGEAVTGTLTQPDSTTQPVTGTTNADLSITFNPITVSQDGTYSVQVSIGADATYGAATSSPFTFTVSDILQARTITITSVSVVSGASAKPPAK